MIQAPEIVGDFEDAYAKRIQGFTVTFDDIEQLLRYIMQLEVQEVDRECR